MIPNWFGGNTDAKYCVDSYVAQYLNVAEYVHKYILALSNSHIPLVGSNTNIFLSFLLLEFNLIFGSYTLWFMFGINPFYWDNRCHFVDRLILNLSLAVSKQITKFNIRCSIFARVNICGLCFTCILTRKGNECLKLWAFVLLLVAIHIPTI